MLKYSIAAIALVAGSSFAIADPNNGGASSGGGTMEHSGSMSGGTTKGDGGASSKEFRSGGMNSDGRQPSDDGAGAMKEKNAASEKMKGNDNNRQAEDCKPGDRAGSQRQAKDQSRPDKGATGAGEGSEGKAGPRGSLTNISPEQKSRVRSAFVSHRVAPARDIGVAVNVGVVVPRSIRVYPVPEDIVTIVPDYSGYEYFMIDDAHVAIVDPETLAVVDIIVVA